jgi:hypothetical protein
MIIDKCLNRITMWNKPLICSIALQEGFHNYIVIHRLASSFMLLIICRIIVPHSQTTPNLNRHIPHLAWTFWIPCFSRIVLASLWYWNLWLTMFSRCLLFLYRQIHYGVASTCCFLWVKLRRLNLMLVLATTQIGPVLVQGSVHGLMRR